MAELVLLKTSVQRQPLYLPQLYRVLTGQMEYFPFDGNQPFMDFEWTWYASAKGLASFIPINQVLQ